MCIRDRYQLSQEIAKYLSAEMDELNVYSHIFRSGLEKCFSKVFQVLIKQPHKVHIFPDTIPGFTLMVFRKTINTIECKPVDLKQKPLSDRELNALEPIIDKFFEKNQQKILLVDTNDLLFAMFPITDTKKYLKEMELYITY